uniref:Uncharacterized protein n=1 Tax=Rhizophora mucronata TaxID=61149 RepID=A0A2P2NJC7_RHIMU
MQCIILMALAENHDIGHFCFVGN